MIIVVRTYFFPLLSSYSFFFKYIKQNKMNSLSPGSRTLSFLRVSLITVPAPHPPAHKFYYLLGYENDFKTVKISFKSKFELY